MNEHICVAVNTKATGEKIRKLREKCGFSKTEVQESLGLVGESGCGKTTITRLINGLIPHYYEGKMSGGVWVNGAEVSKQPL